MLSKAHLMVAAATMFMFLRRITKQNPPAVIVSADEKMIHVRWVRATWGLVPQIIWPHQRNEHMGPIITIDPVYSPSCIERRLPWYNEAGFIGLQLVYSYQCVAHHHSQNQGTILGEIYHNNTTAYHPTFHEIIASLFKTSCILNIQNL